MVLDWLILPVSLLLLLIQFKKKKFWTKNCQMTLFSGISMANKLIRFLHSKTTIGKNCTVHILDVLFTLTLLHSERPKLHTILVFLSAVGLKL